MVTRIVKMTFRTDACDEFLSIFEQYKSRIRAAEGCTHLALLRDTKHAHVFFTYSHWKEESFLNQYRNSETFVLVWPRVKALFAETAEAWTVDEEEVI
jgi:quinol monooxygenase YgiN